MTRTRRTAVTALVSAALALGLSFAAAAPASALTRINQYYFNLSTCRSDGEYKVQHGWFPEIYCMVVARDARTGVAYQWYSQFTR